MYICIYIYTDDMIDAADPTTIYTELTLIAEGESGPIFANQAIISRVDLLTKPPETLTPKTLYKIIFK